MDKVLTSIRELLTALAADASSPLYYNASTNPKGIKRIFRGDPNQIPKDDFPAIVVRPVSSQWTKRQSRYDQKTHQVEVIIVENMNNYKDDSPSDAGSVQSLQAMINMMEGTNNVQSTGAKTIVGCISANPLLPYTDSGTKYAAVNTKPESIDYVFNASRGFPTFEVIALFTVTSQGDRAS